MYLIQSINSVEMHAKTPAESRNCWGSYSIDTDYYDVVPGTGVTREVPSLG